MKAFQSHTVHIPNKHELTTLILAGTLDRTFALSTAEFIAQTFPSRLSIKIYHHSPHVVHTEYLVRVNKREEIETVGAASMPAFSAVGATVKGAIKGAPKRYFYEALTYWRRAWGSLYQLTHIDVQTDETAYAFGQPYVVQVRFTSG